MFLGETDDGGEADVSEEFIDLAQQLFGLHQPVSCPKTVAGPAGPVTAGGPPPCQGPASGCWRRKPIAQAREREPGRRGQPAAVHEVQILGCW